MTAPTREKNQTVLPAGSGEDELRDYLQEIRSYPRLTPQQERDLARRCAQGDEDAVRQMVNCNLRLVVSVAKEYAGRGVPLLDLIQEGSIGLLTAARKFDYTLELRFSTYATKWIRQGVTRCLMNHGAMIRIPEHTAERVRKVRSAKAALLQETGQEPDIESIALRSGIAENKVAEYLRMDIDTCSLDTLIGDDEDTTLGSMLEDVQTPQPQEELVRRELKKTMDALLSMLTPRQQQVLRLRFGMEDGVCYSLEEIGDKLGISKEGARQAEQRALKRLQELGAGFGLEEFLNE